MTGDVQMFWAIKEADGRLAYIQKSQSFLQDKIDERPAMYRGCKVVRVEIREVPHDER